MENLEEKLFNLKKRIAKAKEWLNFGAKQKKVEELEEKMSQTDFWDNPEKASEISQEAADLKEEIGFWADKEKSVDDLAELAAEVEGESGFWPDLEKESAELEREIGLAELKFLLSGRYDKSPAILTVSAGQGGHDAEDFVRMLFNMYTAYFDSKKWPYSVLHENYSEEGGGSSQTGGERALKSISLCVCAKYAYGYLKNEAGVHRLVRVSPFDAKKLRHTSFALVEAMPELADIDLSEIELEEKDLKYDFFRSSGPGGQNVNKRETAVRVVHLPTGLAAACQSERSQAQNRDRALKILRLKLFDYLKNQAKEDANALKKRVEPSWGNQIRNYVFNPYKLVKDLRTGVETSQIDDVLGGNLDDFIQEELKLKK